MSTQPAPEYSLDIENHAATRKWLAARGLVANGDEVALQTLAGGVSNKTVRVEFPDGRQWVLKQALAKLRVRDDWYCDVARIGREAEGLRWLVKIAPEGSITPLVFEAPEVQLLAMEAVRRPFENYRDILLKGTMNRDSLVAFARDFGSMLGSIQSRATGQDIATAFADRSFFEALRLEPYYKTTAGREPDSAGFYRALIDDTMATRRTLVHGDYSPKNILVRDGRLILLDHEVIHFGDGAFDVGFAMAHLLSKAHFVSSRRTDYRQAAVEFWISFAEQCRDADEERCVRHALGCLLARVRGKSPMDYLDPPSRDRQARAVLSLMKASPGGMVMLIDRFLEHLS